MKKSILRAIANVADYGDTDIFPFPIENRVLFDLKEEIAAFLLEKDKDFESFMTGYPPSNHGTLAPVGYTGFRWATQLDPLWNIYFLALVIEIAPKIEQARLPKSDNRVFSYRFNSDASSSYIFKKEMGWRQFLESSIDAANKSAFVVSCDISEFYPRLNHHRLDNALRQLPGTDNCRKKIMEFLSNYSETYSFGLPVGGPAARLLSELTLNQIDRLLKSKRIEFRRFADDFYLFADSQEEAFKNLVYLSQILQRNQGLQLQKSKTRIMSSSEFLSTNPLSMDDSEMEDDKLTPSRRGLISLSLHFDPYSESAADDYERLKSELKKFPILDLIKSELTKSKIDISLSRKIIKALRFIEGHELNDAARTLIENEDLLYPVYFNVCSAIVSIWEKLDSASSLAIAAHIRGLIDGGSAVMAVDLNLQYAVRLLGKLQSEESVATLTAIYDKTDSAAIRQDIILILAKWRDWTWLSDKRARFRAMAPAERRAFIVASYMLADEGKHWRQHTSDEFGPMEMFVRDWMSAKVNTKDWELPI